LSTLRHKYWQGALELGNESITDSHLLEQYFYSYFEVLHRYAYTLLKDNDEAKDAVQTVFVQLWHKRDVLAIRQSARSYLYAATHNQCLNIIKSSKTRTKYYNNFAAEENHTTTAGEASIELKDLKKEILAAMDQLPDKCREIFYKSRFEEKTYPEIAKELNISVKTVEAQMSKALRILRTILAGKTFWFILCCQLLAQIKLPR
jgi:RNA polymerase sigma-70 factor (ECF subfamily)